MLVDREDQARTEPQSRRAIRRARFKAVGALVLAFGLSLPIIPLTEDSTTILTSARFDCGIPLQALFSPPGSSCGDKAVSRAQIAAGVASLGVALLAFGGIRRWPRFIGLVTVGVSSFLLMFQTHGGMIRGQVRFRCGSALGDLARRGLTEISSGGATWTLDSVCGDLAVKRAHLAGIVAIVGGLLVVGDAVLRNRRVLVEDTGASTTTSEAASVASASRRNRTPWWRVFVVMIATLAFVVRVPRIVDDVTAFRAGPAGFTIYEDPVDGWTVQFPSSWHAERFSEKGEAGPYETESRGVFISNISFTPPFESGAVPARLVAVQIAYSYGGGFVGGCRNETPPPLSLGNARRFDYALFADSVLRDDREAEVKHLLLPFSIKEVPLYMVAAWIGSQASEADLAALDRIVGSVGYEAGRPRPDLHVRGCAQVD